MKIVLDSNVIISAFGTRGLCFDVLSLCLFEHEVITSLPLIEEVIKSLEEDFQIPKASVKQHRDILLKGTIVIIPFDVSPKICRDPKNLKILGTAWAGKSDFIVTGDKDLLVLKEFKGVDILTPRDFWIKLRT